MQRDIDRRKAREISDHTTHKDIAKHKAQKAFEKETQKKQRKTSHLALAKRHRIMQRKKDIGIQKRK